MFDNAFGLAKRLGGLGCLMAGIGWLVSGCTTEVLGEMPPDSGLYYPNNMVSSDGRYVYILNSNFDQRYNAGWISVLDLGQQEPHLYTRAEGGQLRVLSLGGDLALDKESNPSQLVVSHRGSGTLSLVDLQVGDGEKVTLSCGEQGDKAGLRPEESVTDCSKDRLYRLPDAVAASDLEIDVDYVRDPYALQYRSSGDAMELAVGFVSFEHVLLLDVDGQGKLGSPRSYSLGDGVTGGIESLALLPGEPDYLIGTANGRSYVYTMNLQSETEQEQGEYQRYSVGSAAAGSDLVDIALTTEANAGEPERTYAYVAANKPGLLALVEIKMQTRLKAEPDGSYTRVTEPAIQLLDTLAFDGSPSGLSLLKSATGERLFVANFESNEVVVVARKGQSLLVERILGKSAGIGDGPYSLRAIDCSSALGQGCARLVVANFFSHSVSVLDIGSSDAMNFEKVVVLK